MQYSKWFNQTVKSVTPPSGLTMYIRIGIFSAVIFGLCYAYTSWLKIPGVLNKSVADTAVILIGLSMLLSGLCYFWDFVDSKIIYRKHLGLVGFGYGVVHTLLSYQALLNLFKTETWQKQAMWAPLMGLLALVVFTVMALISNQYAAHQLGGKVWRFILRTGYIALLFVFVHVVVLKLARWTTWWQGGMKTLPAMSIIAAVFILVVVIMRILLWFSLHRKK